MAGILSEHMKLKGDTETLRLNNPHKLRFMAFRHFYATYLKSLIFHLVFSTQGTHPSIRTSLIRISLFIISVRNNQITISLNHLITDIAFLIIFVPFMLGRGILI